MRRATAALAAGALALTGCAPVNDNGDGTVTMPWWYFWQQQQHQSQPVTPAPVQGPGATPRPVTPAQPRQAPPAAPRQAPAPAKAPAPAAPRPPAPRSK